MKKIMKNFVCMFLCVIMAVSIIQIPEKVTGETTESFILYRYMDAKTEKYGIGKSIGMQPFFCVPIWAEEKR